MLLNNTTVKTMPAHSPEFDFDRMVVEFDLNSNAFFYRARFVFQKSSPGELCECSLNKDQPGFGDIQRAASIAVSDYLAAIGE